MYLWGAISKNMETFDEENPCQRGLRKLLWDIRLIAVIVIGGICYASFEIWNRVFDARLRDMTAREQSLDAGDLTKAVICAENTAEVTKDAANAEEAAQLLEQMEGVSDIAVEGETVTATQNGFRIEATLTPEEGTAGTYVDELINIYPGDGTAIYQMHTGSYIKEGAR